MGKRITCEMRFYLKRVVFRLTVLAIVLSSLFFPYTAFGGDSNNRIRSHLTMRVASPSHIAQEDLAWGINDPDTRIELDTLEMQSDQKVVLAGSIFNGRDDDFVVIRYTEAGESDDTFGLNGLVVTDFGASEDKPYSISIRSDRTINVAGVACTKGKKCSLVVARYLPNGKLDRTFGKEGKLVTKIHSTFKPKSRSFKENSDGTLTIGATFCDKFNDCESNEAVYARNGAFVKMVTDPTIEQKAVGLVISPEVQKVAAKGTAIGD